MTATARLLSAAETQDHLNARCADLAHEWDAWDLDEEPSATAEALWPLFKDRVFAQDCAARGSSVRLVVDLVEALVFTSGPAAGQGWTVADVEVRDLRESLTRVALLFARPDGACAVTVLDLPVSFGGAVQTLVTPMTVMRALSSESWTVAASAEELMLTSATLLDPVTEVSMVAYATPDFDVVAWLLDRPAGLVLSSPLVSTPDALVTADLAHHGGQVGAALRACARVRGEAWVPPVETSDR